jgi:agmatinase
MNKNSVQPLTPLPPSIKSPRIIFESADLGQGFYPNSCHLIGFGFDGTACFRKGTKDGPDAIRQVSDGIESYSPYLDHDLSDITFYDCGNLSLGVDGCISESVDEQWRFASDNLYHWLNQTDLAKHQVKLMTLGGEHSISYAPIKAYLEQFPDLVLIHLDAHADLRDGYEGHHYSHASIIYRVVEHFTEQHQLLQYGIRSGTKSEYQWMQQHDSLCTSLEQLLSKVEQLAADTPIYLTLDLDYFDPSFFPGTGTPEPGGEDFHSFIKLLKRLSQKNLVGCDVVELAPNIDPTGNSDVFAAKVVRELLLCMNK